MLEATREQYQVVIYTQVVIYNKKKSVTRMETKSLYAAARAGSFVLSEASQLFSVSQLVHSLS